MSFPIDDRELKAAYYHLKDFGQETHADAVKRLATQVKETGDILIRMRRRILELEKPKASYQEIRNRDLERRTRNRPASNE